MGDYVLSSSTVTLLTVHCSEAQDAQPQLPALRVLTSLLYAAQALPVFAPYDSNNNAMTSIRRYSSVKHQVARAARHHTPGSQNTEFQQWLHHVQTAVIQLRAPFVGPMRFFPITTGEENALVEIDNLALQLIDEIRHVVESDMDPGYNTIAALSDCIVQLKGGRSNNSNRKFVCGHLWSKFLTSNDIPRNQQDLLTTELFRVVVAGLTWPPLPQATSLYAQPTAQQC